MSHSINTRNMNETTRQALVRRYREWVEQLRRNKGRVLYSDRDYLVTDRGWRRVNKEAP